MPNNNNSTGNTQIAMVPIYFAGLIGAVVSLFSCLVLGKGGTIQNTTERLGDALFIAKTSYAALRFCVMLFVILFGYIICWIYTPSNKVDAFIRGCSVLSLLSLSPNTGKDSQNITISNKIKQNEFTNSYNIQKSPYCNKQVEVIYANYLGEGNMPQLFSPNATILYNEWVSSCKPTAGFWAFLLNNISICKNNDVLVPGQRVQVLFDSIYDTNNGYRYRKIMYQKGNIDIPGWIYTGRTPDSDANIAFDRNLLNKQLKNKI